MSFSDLGSRLGSISRDQFQAALERFGLGAFRDAQPVSGGNFGQVCFLTSSEGEWVFRGNPLVPGQFGEEAYFSDLLHRETQVPVAWPYLLERSSELFGWPYAIMPRMPGIDFDLEQRAGRTSDSDDWQVARLMGQLLAETQVIVAPGPSIYDGPTESLRDSDQDSAHSMIQHATELMDRSAETGGTISDADRDWLVQGIVRARDAFGQPFVARLTIGDFKDQNMVFQNDDGRWQVTGLFDLMGTHFGMGERALARQFCKSLAYRRIDAGAFVTAYVEQMGALPGFGERLACFVTLEQLAIWEWAWRTDMVWWDRSTSLRQWLQPFVEEAKNIGE